MGKATFPNNDVYEGSFEDGLRNGSGTYTYAAPPPSEEEAEEEERKPVAVYNGTWRAGEKTGVGTMTYTEGGKYHGAWLAGKRSGEGTFYYPNGDIYSGKWEEGKKHGHGTYIYKESQSRLKGTWEMGQCVSGEFTDRYGNTYKGKFAGDAVSVGYALGGVFTLASGASAPSTMPVNAAFAKAGFCPVSYWSPNEPYAGNADHKISVGGISYCISPGNVAAFTASPSKYLPQFGGFCTVGIAHGNASPPPNYLHLAMFDLTLQAYLHLAVRSYTLTRALRQTPTRRPNRLQSALRQAVPIPTKGE